MDVLAGFLDGPRARGAFLLRSVMDPPWSLRIEDRSKLTVVSVVSGEVWIVPDRTEPDTRPVGLYAGDTAVVTGDTPYTVADSADRAPFVRILPGQVCVDLQGNTMAEQMALGVRTWGNIADRGTGQAIMLTGTYQGDGEVSRQLLQALPRVLALRAGDWDCPVVALLATEIVRDDPGQEAVLDRLLDLLAAVLRAWFARSDAPGVYAALADPVVGAALRLLQHNPRHPWTVDELARRAGLSRAALARRFTELVGEPPIAFLTGWRLTLAADLLRDPDATVARVAHAVGYGSPFTFSTAFKRRFGRSPQEYRRRPVAVAIGA